MISKSILLINIILTTGEVYVLTSMELVVHKNHPKYSKIMRSHGLLQQLTYVQFMDFTKRKKAT